MVVDSLVSLWEEGVVDGLFFILKVLEVVDSGLRRKDQESGAVCLKQRPHLTAKNKEVG